VAYITGDIDLKSKQIASKIFMSHSQLLTRHDGHINIRAGEVKLKSRQRSITDMMSSFVWYHEVNDYLTMNEYVQAEYIRDYFRKLRFLCSKRHNK
jgi:hypothetical protein